MIKLILASKNSEILIDIMDYVTKLPRVIEEKKLNKPTEIYVESVDDGAMYYYLKADCENGLTEYLKGFCCGYMAGKGFKNE